MNFYVHCIRKNKGFEVCFHTFSDTILLHVRSCFVIDPNNCVTTSRVYKGHSISPHCQYLNGEIPVIYMLRFSLYSYIYVQRDEIRFNLVWNEFFALRLKVCVYMIS